MKTQKLFERKGISVRVVCALLSLIIFVGTLPMSVLAADAEQNPSKSTNGSGFSDYDLMDNDVVPDGFTTTTNPYGYGIDVPFLMVEQNELMVLRDYGNSTGIGHNDYWDLQSGTQMVDFVNKINTNYNGYDEFTAAEYDLVQAVAFDPTGSGRNDHVAFVGLKNKKGYMWVIDTRKSKNGGDSSSAVAIGDFSTLYDDDKLNIDTYRTRSIVDIVAGDFDGDGKETVVVYTPQALKNRRDKMTGKGLNDTDRGCVVQEWRYQSNGKSISKVGEGYTLLMDAYVNRHTVSPDSEENSAYYWIDKDDDAHSVLRNKLGVSMTVDDFNGDGVDDLAVLSYSHKRYYENQPIAYYTPLVKIVYGQKNNASTITNRKAAQTFTFRTDHPSKARYYQFPVAAELTSGDLDGDGDIDLFLAGMLGEIAEQQGNENYAYNNMTMYASTFYVGRMTNNGGSFAKSLSKTINANNWTYGGYYDNDHVYQKIAVEAVAINGHAAAEMVFVNGTLYNCISEELVALSYTGGNYFGSEDDGAGSNTISNTSFNSIAVGNFDGNDAGREQVLFTVALQHKGSSGSHLAAGYMRGTSYADKTNNGTVTQYGTAGAYECKVDTDSYVDANAANHVNFLFIAVDRDYDGILAKYRGPEYAYTDPDVKAVLQAAPYFSDISDAGNNETEYRLIESYELSQSTSNEVSFSVGYVGEFGADEGPKVSIEAGYALDWTETFEKSLRTEFEASFSAQAYNSVVIYRIPVFIYCFDIQKTDGAWHNKTAMQTAIPQGPVYEQLSVDAYNEFVDIYNDYMAEWNDPDDYHKLYKIDTEANYLAENEGNPYGYYSNAGGWSALPDGQPISKAGTALGTNGGINKVAWTKENTETYETTMSHGFYFSFTFTYGFPGQAHGVSTSLEYSHGKGRASTTGTAIGASCSVTDIDGPGLMSEGVPQSVINSYGFNWALGQWTQHLSGEPENKTTFVGFNLTNIKSPSPAVYDLRAETINENTIELNWSKPEAAGWPDITGYYVYMLDEFGEYPQTPTSEKISPDVTSYTLTGLDSNTEYTFVIVTVRTLDNQEIRSTWSNPAYAVTAKNFYTVMIENATPQAVDLKVRHLGNIAIESGDEIPEENIVKITASPKSAAYTITSIEVTKGEKEPVVLVPDANGSIVYSFVLNDNTSIRVNTKKIGVSAHIIYTGHYVVEGKQIGTVTATENGTAFESGSIATSDVVFTAHSAEGYTVKEWVITDQVQTIHVPGDESNSFTLSPEADTYVVYAEFMKSSAQTATVHVIAPEGGTIEITDSEDKKYIADKDGKIIVPVGTTLNFNAVANDGCTFAGWLQDAVRETTRPSFEKTIDSNFTVGVEFNIPEKVTVAYSTATGDETGIIADSFSKITEGTVNKGTVLIFTAQAAENYRIEKWTVIKNGVEEIITLDEITSYDSIQVVADADVSVNVYFVELEQYTLTFPAQIEGFELTVYNNGVAVLPGDSIAEGTKLTAELLTDSTHVVKSWSINGEDKGCFGYTYFIFVVFGDTQLSAVVVDLKGDPGEDGKDGTDGQTPYVGDNGNWWIGDTDTGIKAAGTDGENGKDGTDGEDGSDGQTPCVGDNGNWWVGDTDTGIKAAGTDGKDGIDGADGKDGKDGKDGSDAHLCIFCITKKIVLFVWDILVNIFNTISNLF